MEKVLARYGSYEKFEMATGGQLLTKTQLWNTVKRYLEKEGFYGDVVVNISNDLIARAAMTVTGGRPTLSIRESAAKKLWVEGLLRHEIGKLMTVILFLHTNLACFLPEFSLFIFYLNLAWLYEPDLFISSLLILRRIGVGHFVVKCELAMTNFVITMRGSTIRIKKSFLSNCRNASFTFSQ